MTSEQTKTYEQKKEFGFEYDYTDSDGRIHMTKWDRMPEAAFRLKEIVIELSGDLLG
jgi:hypothetical protein